MYFTFSVSTGFTDQPQQQFKIFKKREKSLQKETGISVEFVQRVIVLSDSAGIINPQKNGFAMEAVRRKSQ